ncbi:MAG: DUF736 family protein [Acetobacteraceae bacterium]
MPTIGSFSQDDLFGQEGILETATLKAKVKFVPLRHRSEKQPDFRILAGKSEIGAPWLRTSKKGGAYLLLSGGRHWSIVATLIVSAKLNNVEPLAWLTDVLERVVSGRTKNHELDALLPWTWKATREAEAASTA